LTNNFGWNGTISELFYLGEERLVSILESFLVDHGFPVNKGHRDSWLDTYRFLYNSFSPYLDRFKDLYIVFEYMLPLEKGRRPDVLLMLEGRIIVLEFKEKDKVLLEDIEQIIGYREDLTKFHHITYEKQIRIDGYLVVTALTEHHDEIRGIEILSKHNFHRPLQLGNLFLNAENVMDWLESPYVPLPTVTSASLDLFQHGELPHIKNIEEGAISKTVNYIKKNIYQNDTQGKKNLIFVSGVPGAGKTLVALKTLYDYNFYQYRDLNNPLAAIYLSGNGPLVNVLQEQLQSTEFNGSSGKAFIKGVFAFKKEYLNNQRYPPFHCIFFDEAQRAWDQNKMGGQFSEPEGLLHVGEKIYDHHGSVTIVCFIGDGQTIHIGEEQGIGLWEKALINYPGWRVYIPPNYTNSFQKVHHRVINELFLDTSIRSNFIDTSNWVESIIELNPTKAKKELIKMQEKGYILRISRSYEASKRFIESKKKEYPDVMYGLLVSSKAEQAYVRKVVETPSFSSFMKDTDAGKWFLKESKEWRNGATEFVCQGLELDFPLVCFGGDYLVQRNQWMVESHVYRKHNEKFENFDVIVQNIYRILLSRARRGMVLYITEDPSFDDTYEFFIQMGADVI
jgi:hypothetical protein